ncbi:IS1 family transposase [Flavobacterium litorale]|uniref:IS1 family transposase n=1 Tax=Flavobacterium litorale TaxID=2856519 RepID=A0ABX8VG17_9FLAO|nr:IS1 family transposase [Flavobacterium litorale]
MTYAIERTTKKVIVFHISNKIKENVKPLVNTVLSLNPSSIYTNRLNIYPGLISKAIRKRFQYCTNIIERTNLTLRIHIKRSSKKTICFSKSIIHIEIYLKIYFWE